jgi:hypothetical protein
MRVSELTNPIQIYRRPPTLLPSAVIGEPAPESRAGKVDAPQNRGRQKAPDKGDLSVSSTQHATNQYEGPTRHLPSVRR